MATKLDEALLEIQKTVDEYKNLKRINDFYRKQLLVIAVNNGGKIKDLDYKDLNEIDFNRITIGIGFDSLSVTNTTSGKLLKNWDDVPIKPE